jgi:hypothetical protein
LVRAAGLELLVIVGPSDAVDFFAMGIVGFPAYDELVFGRVPFPHDNAIVGPERDDPLTVVGELHLPDFVCVVLQGLDANGWGVWFRAFVVFE